MLTVVVATKNRAPILNRALDSFAGLESPAGGWKMVLVDNGSVDSTPEVLRAHSRRLPIQTVRETMPGMNAALHAALGHVEGDLMVKTDDDVLPCSSWLVQYRQAADAHPGRSLFGGTVEPEWPGQIPAWLSERAANFGILYAKSREPEGPCPLSRIYGPNWAIRSNVFSSGMRFDERIGPDSTRVLYPMGGETEFFSRLISQGHLGYFVPRAAVRHIIRPEQLSEEWILDRAYRNGLGVGLTSPPKCAKGVRLRGQPLALLLRLIAYGAIVTVARPLPRSALRLRLLFWNSWFRGLSDSVRKNTDAAHRAGSETMSAKTGARLT